MPKAKNTKRALLASVLSMLLCVSMLAGSTFAWFTDSVTSGKNKIVAGNLDVELEYATFSVDEETNETVTTWKSVEGVSLFDEGALWEPGYTQVVYLRVRNAGTLALKYKFGINVVSKVIGKTADDKDIDLSDFIEFGVVKADKSFADRADARAAVKDSAALISAGYSAKEGHLTAGKTSDMLALVVYMPEDVGNAANHGTGKTQPSINMGINLVATQDAVEKDSFGEKYDKDVKYPVVISAPVTSGNPIILQSNKDADTGIKLTADADSLPESVTEVKLTIEDRVLPSTIKITEAQESKAFEITLRDQNGNEIAANEGSLFTVELNLDGGLSGVSVYHKDTLMVDDGKNLTEAADHYIYDKESGIVTMKVSSFSPFTVLYNNGEYEEVAFGLYKIADQNNAYAVANADGFAALNEAMAAQKYDVASITLLNDIDMTGKTWTPVDLHADRTVRSLSLINGKGHTISNLNINGQAMFARFAGSADLITIKDLTFDTATVSYNSLMAAIVAGQCYQNVLFDNVDVKNSAITGSYKVSPYIGQVHDEKPTGVTVTLKDCDVSDTVVTGTGYDFCITGMVAFVHEEYCEKVEFENCTVRDVTLKAPYKLYGSCAAVYCNDGDAEGSFNEVEGVTVTNVTVEYTAG